MKTITKTYEVYKFSELSEEAQNHAVESEFLKSICEDYRIILSKEYDHLTSREAIIETIEANDYDFTEDGTIF